MRYVKKLDMSITALLQLVIIIGLLFSILERNIFNSIIIGIILFLTFLPKIFSKKFKIFIPKEFELIIVVFIFASLFLGEMRGYYVKMWWWDILLHTSSGILLGMMGFLLVYILNKEKTIGLYMKPGFVALFSFSFALAIGSLWEIFEFGMDSFFAFNMQKSGLIDTMWDIIVDTLGAMIISISGYFYLNKKNNKSITFSLIKKFINKNEKLFKDNK